MRIFLVMTAVLQAIHADVDTKHLRSVLEAALDQHVPVNVHHSREGRQLQSADPGAIMYLPIGGGGNVRYYTVYYT